MVKEKKSHIIETTPAAISTNGKNNQVQIT